MNCPPIPPKSKFFKKFTKPDRILFLSAFSSEVIALDVDEPFIVNYFGPCSKISNNEKFTIAAIAEVEWQLRYERWKWIQIRYGFSNRAKRASKEQGKIVDIIKKWREWGGIE